MSRIKGKVKFYKEEKGFGFIIPEEDTRDDIFFHISNVEDGYVPNKGDNVEYLVGESLKGKTQAEEVRVL